MLDLILLLTVLVEAGCMIAVLLLILCIIRQGREDFRLFRRKETPIQEPEDTAEEPETRRKSVDEGIDNLMTYSLDVAKETRRGREEWP